MNEVDMIGFCVMGEDYEQENKTFTSFDGEFEGLAPSVGLRFP